MLQFRITLGLASAHNNVTVVGDEQQSIYGFRGAEFANMRRFSEIPEFKPTLRLCKLGENFS